jgi:hypothetical protein
LWRIHGRDGDGTKILDLLSSCSDKRPIALSFSMTLRRAVFSS